MRLPTTLLGAFALAAIANPVGAQVRARGNARIERIDTPNAVVWSSADEDEDRAMLGISTNSAGERDTLGLMITSVTPGGPAEKAGIEEGNRIASINGTSLKLSSADAGEPDMNGVMTRRLSREMRKVKAGDEVELRVWANGAYKTVKVKTVASEDLRPRRVRMTREDMEDRPVIGVSAQSTGSRRDTLGIMVGAVAENGPAEKAGIFEGDRIASVNGVDLRVSRDDAGDDWVGNAKANRFTRELRKVKVGDDVELRVYSNGAYKTVKVKAARAADVYKNEGRGGTFFFGDVGVMAPVPPVPPMPPMPPMIGPRLQQLAPRVVLPRGTWQLNQERVNEAIERALGAAAAADRWQQLDDEDELVETPAPAPSARTAPAPRATPAPKAATAGFAIQASWTPEANAAVLTLPGLRASRMDRDLAGYFGDAESVGDGLLVLDADESWEGLLVGDVIVAVNGQRVRNGDPRSVRLDRSRENVLEVVRRGKCETVRIPAA